MRLRSTFVLVVFLLASAAGAATFIVPDDARLVDSAHAIVVATALGSFSRVDAEGMIETVYTLAIDDVIKGDVRGTTIEISQWGGHVGDRWLVQSGAPSYEAGQRYLIFLDTNKWDEWTTLDLSLGRFRFARTPRAEDLLVRDGEAFGWDASGEPNVELARPAAAFLQFVRDVVEGHGGAATYMTPPAERVVLRPDTVLSPTYTGTQYCELLGGEPARRKNPSVVWHIWGTQTGLDLGLASQRGCAAWTNDASSNVSYSVGSAATGNTAANCDGGAESRIIAEDPNNMISGTFSGSGTVATAFFGGGGTNTWGGETYITITCSDIVVQDGVGASLGQAKFDTTLTHEIGHTLGFRHSNKTPDNSDACASPLPCSSSAIMNSSLVSGIGSTLQSWDKDAVSTVYGSGPVCTAPSITTQPASKTIDSGTSTTLTVAASGSGTLSYQWYKGAKGDTSNPVGTNSTTLNTGTLTATTSYWVRVSNSCGSADSNAATVTVTAVCATPIITTQPQSATVATGGSRTLTVAATGAVSYQWYIGLRGTTTNPVGTNSTSYNTGALSASTNFWVRVTNTCGSVDSATAAITVCDAPAITTQPANATVTSGNSANLTVTASGTNLSYTWYQGTAPDRSMAVANTRSYTTPPLTSNTNYWVRVSNSCGTANSNTVLVSVVAACVAPAITTQPAGVSITSGATATLRVVATGTSLLYEWFQGSSGDTSRPTGTNSDTLTTSALTATTNYWVRVSNSCGTMNSSTAIVTVVAACKPPAITSQPASTNVKSGATATLVVVATGDAILTYQWYRGTASDTSSPVGTGSARFTTLPVTARTSYWVRVSNSCGSADSTTAVVSPAGRKRAIRR